MGTVQTHELGGTFERFVALVIDSILFSIIGGVIGLNLDLIGGGFISILSGAAYQWYFLTRHNGQTIGKMIMGLQVIKVDGTEISDSDAILRYVGYYIGMIIIGLGFIWAIFDDKNQGWHDKLARTYVIKR